MSRNKRPNGGDEELRRLERLAELGEAGAKAQLHRERRWRGIESPLWRGARRLAQRGLVASGALPAHRVMPDLVQNITILARERATAMANELAAYYGSTPPERAPSNDLVDLSRDWIVATFGNSTVYAGDPEGDTEPPEHYVLTTRGGEVEPETEEFPIDQLVENVMDLAFQTDEHDNDTAFLQRIERVIRRAVGLNEPEHWLVRWRSSPGHLTIYEPEIRCRDCGGWTGYGATEVRDGDKTGDCEACEPEICATPGCGDPIDHQDDSDYCNYCRKKQAKSKKPKKNPDEELRALERAAKSGDEIALTHLAQERIRRGIPVFDHDCDTCVFLGTAAQTVKKGRQRIADLYYCPSKSSLGGSAIARFSSVDSEYASQPAALAADLLFSPAHARTREGLGPENSTWWILRAWERARDRGLLKARELSGHAVGHRHHGLCRRCGRASDDVNLPPFGLCSACRIGDPR